VIPKTHLKAEATSGTLERLRIFREVLSAKFDIV